MPEVGDAFIETVANHYGVGDVVPIARVAANWAQSRITEHFRSNKPAVSNLPSEEKMSTGQEEAHGQKRSRHEQSGMEPSGHGNTPATGTKQEGYIERYVPVNFPDKITLKLRYCNSYTMRSIATAGTAAVPATIAWNINSMNAIDSLQAGVFTGLTGTHPNQFNGVWKTLYGYYRVCQLDYKIECSNLSNTQFTETAISATNTAAMSDAIVTLLPTQTNTDITVTGQKSTWEQKEAKNVYVQARSPGAIKSYHCFHGTVCSEDYDIDPVQTAQDETWTAVANSPATTKKLGLLIVPASQFTTAALFPEVQMQVFIDFTFTVQLAGYLPTLRQATG